MLEAIRYNLRNIANPNGRDARQTFWYYVLFLFVVQFALGLVISIPMYITIFSSVFDAVNGGTNPDLMIRRMAEDMAGMMRTQVLGGIIIGIISAGMIITSIVRRCHDVGYTGWIVLVPIATQIFSMVYSLSFLDRMEEIMLTSMTEALDNPGGPSATPDAFAMQAEMGLPGLVGWIGYIVVIVIGVMKSQDGPNSYGEEPVRF